MAIARNAAAGRSRRTPRLIVGLIPKAIGPMAAEMRQALDERSDLIEARANAVLDEALLGGVTWTRELGAFPHPSVPIPNASAVSLAGFLRTHVSPGSTVITDGWPPYQRAFNTVGLTQEVRNVSASGQPAHVSLPGVHRLFSLAKRVLEGMYQGSVQPEHLQAYLDEFVFRFNRRASHKRGLLFFRLLEAAVAGSPTPYKDIAAIKRRPLVLPIPPSIPRDLPRTLAGRPLDRPWRAA